MSSAYLKLKKRFSIRALFVSLVSAFSAGALVFAVLFLILKFSTGAGAFFVALASGIGSALVAFFIVYLLLYPFDRRFSAFIDSQMRLSQKVETMVEFSDKSGEIIDIQREDTDRMLSSLDVRRLLHRGLWIVILCFCVSVSAFACALAIPAPPPADGGGVDDPAFVFTDWHRAALLELIESVRSSDMESVPKDGVIKELSGLLEKLSQTTTQSVMRNHVVEAIVKIDLIVKTHNTYKTVGGSLSAKASNAELSRIADAILSLNSLSVKDDFVLLKDSILKGDVKAGFGELKSITEAVISDSGLSDTDPFAAALSYFARSLGDLLSSTDDSDAVNSVFNIAAEKLSSAMLVQYTNEQVSLDTVKRLMSIFGIKKSDLPADVIPEEDDTEVVDPPQEDKDEINSGGLGSGEIVYGSDDYVYDPVTDTYVKYGDVINAYYAAVSEKILDGEAAASLEEFINDYFKALYDGSKQEENN